MIQLNQQRVVTSLANPKHIHCCTQLNQNNFYNQVGLLILMKAGTNRGFVHLCLAFVLSNWSFRPKEQTDTKSMMTDTEYRLLLNVLLGQLGHKEGFQNRRMWTSCKMIHCIFKVIIESH